MIAVGKVIRGGRVSIEGGKIQELEREIAEGCGEISGLRMRHHYTWYYRTGPWISRFSWHIPVLFISINIPPRNPVYTNRIDFKSSKRRQPAWR
jgi:hypothetical protein